MIKWFYNSLIKSNEWTRYKLIMKRSKTWLFNPQEMNLESLAQAAGAKHVKPAVFVVALNRVCN